MRIRIYTTLVAVSLTAFGCSDDGKKIEPKISESSKVDPRLKPAEAGFGASPAQGKTQGSVKGE